ncbi:helix-turn-helix domain-containing protein [Streptomyces brasiliscabiei]|uniref:helix-turn-helix domain-containing protein n=1 Tax=Streptomyces brasiliscabiei TaxID=2736302 RepID=UPI003AF6D518
MKLTEQGVGKYPHRWGLSFQRPDKRAVEQNLEAVRPTSDVARPLWRQPSVKADGCSGTSDVLSVIQDHLARALHKVLKNNSDH